MDSDAIGQLGGLALGEVLSQLDLDRDALSAVQNQLGLGGAAFSRESIYNDKFEEDEKAEDTRTDFETIINQEMESEKYRNQGQASVNKSAALVRGEEDDFDEDEDGDDDEGGAAGAGGDIGKAPDPAEPTTTNGLYKREASEGYDEDDDDDEGAGDGLFGDDDDDEPEAEAIVATAEAGEGEVARAPSPEYEAIAAPPPMKQVDVKELFPRFDKGKTLDFTELFSTRPRKRAKKAFPPPQLELPTPEEVGRAKSTRDLLVQPMKALPPRTGLRALLVSAQEREREEWEDEGSSDEELVKAIQASNRVNKAKMIIPDDPEDTFANAEVDRWEDNIIWGPGYQPPPTGMGDAFVHRNIEFDRGDWVKSIIWDKSKPYKDFTKLNLNLNDTEMILEVQEPPKPGAAPVAKVSTVNPIAREPGLDPFNISNDKEYEVTKETKKKIRQTFGLLEVKHAYPAEKLQLPFYKTQLTKVETRAFHRTPLQFPANLQLSFSKSKSSKKKKDSSGRKIKRAEGEGLRHMADITLKDTSPFVLWEFSEERPPIISNVGMGSIIVNYYRKTDPDDDYIPKEEIGEPFLLEGTDESPFKTFGYVRPGQTVTAIYNNLIRAPIFKHEPPSTDFLVVRVTIGTDVKYFLREIKTTFVVGQTYPVTEVPGPHSRKITTLLKNRLQIIAVKLTQKDPENRIKVHRLTRYFPEQNDLQMRQRLKEFMQFSRKGEGQGFWQLKNPNLYADEQELLRAATPEMVCLAESMQVGVRHLQDAGYGQTEEGGGEDEMKLDIEQQLAPWITTKNFINATASKARLAVHGPGDPTGRGEAFSFLRVSMKDRFLRDGEKLEERMQKEANRPKSAHKYNVQEEEEIYKQEIERVWGVQWNSLANPVPPQLTQEDEIRARGSKGRNRVGELQSAVGTPRDRFDRGASPSASRAGSPDEDDDNDGTSVGTGRNPGQGGQHKTLRIKRLIDGEWKTEIVRDQSIINAYVRQRQLIDEEKLDADGLLLSDDEGKNERRKKRLKEQLEKLKRNQERRLQRKNQKAGYAVGEMGIGGKLNVKTETTRICGNCGQRGHMKTSRKLCPRWAEFNQPKASEPSNALPSSFASGLALPPMGAAPAPAPKPAIKLKFGGGGGGGGAGSPPAGSPPMWP